eukprot:scpid106363/ scgid5710/ 
MCSVMLLHIHADYAEVGDRVESPLCNSNHPQLTYRRVAMVPMPAKAGSLAPAYVVQHQPPVAGYLYSFQVIMPAFDGVMAAFACSIGVAQPQRQDFYVIMHKGTGLILIGNKTERS